MTDEEAPERLGPWARSALIGFGLVVLIAALPVGFYGLVLAAFIMAPGHGVTPEAIDWAAGLSLFVFPLLMLALAGFSLACTTWRRLAVVGALLGALVVEGGLALWLLHLGSRSDDPPSGITRYPDVESAKKAMEPPGASAGAKGPQRPQPHAIDCSPATGKCVETRSKAK